MSQDFRINAQVRALFVRLNVDLAKIEHGSTNGVVYVRGNLRVGILNRSDEDEGRLSEARFVHRVERAMRKLPGVRDVVLKLDRLVKVGSRWKPQ